MCTLKNFFGYTENITQVIFTSQAIIHTETSRGFSGNFRFQFEVPEEKGQLTDLRQAVHSKNNYNAVLVPKLQSYEVF